MTALLPQVAYGLCSSAETLFTAQGGFGIDASPVQRAICRIADGVPLGDLVCDDAVRRAVGDLAALPSVRPREIAILSGIRVGKSLIAACLAIHWAMTCDVSRLGPGEIARVSVLSTTKDNADVIFSHCLGQLQASPWLAVLIVGKPTADTITLRHSTGRLIEIKVVAGSRAGASLVSRWSAGCIFDEFPRMIGGDDGVVNWDDSRAAILLRLLPGAQLAHVGSPWAPFGPAYQMVVEHWKKPSHKLVVIRAPAYDMNPKLWTPELCAEAKEADPDVYLTDVEAEFAAPEEALFGSTELAAASREAPDELPPVEGHSYVAAIDPAHRSNAWTFVVGTREGRKKRIVLARQWVGTRLDPLASGAVLAEIGELCGRYGIKFVETDQYHVDTLAELARQAFYVTKSGEQLPKRPISLVLAELTEKQKVESWLTLRFRVSEGEVEFPPDPVFRADMQRLKKRTTQSGVQIVLPKTSDGRHCDYAPSTLLVLRRWLHDVDNPPPAAGSLAASRKEEDRMFRDAQKQFGRKKNR